MIHIRWQKYRLLGSQLAVDGSFRSSSCQTTVRSRPMRFAELCKHLQLQARRILILFNRLLDRLALGSSPSLVHGTRRG